MIGACSLQANARAGVGLTPTLSWSSVSGADVYQLGIHDGVSWFLVVQTADTSYMVPSGKLVSGHRYVWCVFAHNAIGWSSSSVGRSFITVA